MSSNVMTRDVSTKTSYLLALLIPFCILMVHAFYYYPFFADDAFISLRYAQRLIEGKGLNWNDGEYVEGYSNLLWVLTTALLGFFDIDLVAAGRAVGFVASAAAMYSFSYYHMRRYSSSNSLFMTNLAFALTAPVAIWMLGGLEAALTMSLLAWVYVLAHDVLEYGDKKKSLYCGILLGLVSISRPEGAIFTVMVAVSIFVVSGNRRWKRVPCLAQMCFISFLFFASQLAFRLSYYGDWVANTYYVKVAFTESRLINGMMYCLKALASLLPILLAISIKMDTLLKNPEYREQKRSVCFLTLICAMWIFLLVIAGGDIFPGYRHILLIVPALILMLMHSLDVIYANGKRLSNDIFYGYVLLCFLWLQVTFEENQKARHEDWLWNTRELAQMLKTEYGDKQPLVAITLAGIIPYYSGLPSVDMYGLNDAYMTKHRDEDSGYGKFGEGFIGHELFNSKYIMSRKPDIIIFHAGNKPPLYSMGNEPDFIRYYESRKIKLPSYTAEIWVRKDSQKVQSARP